MKKTEQTETTGQESAAKNSYWTYDYRRHKHHGGGVGAVVLILVGLIFLLYNFGLLPGDFWSQFWKFWPVLLILWGLQIIGSQSRISNFIVTVLAIIIILLIVAWIIAPTNPALATWLHTYIPWLPLPQTQLNTNHVFHLPRNYPYQTY